MAGRDADSTYHDGELAVQARAGTREQSADAGRHVFRNAMTDQHREFFHKLPFIVAGAMDADHQPWATLLVGRPGFISAPTLQRLEIATLPGAGDPVGAFLKTGYPIGLLGIELHTRRRNRLNGTIVAATGDGIAVSVSQSFGNCPKYIQARDVRPASSSPTVGEVRYSDGLDTATRELIAAADTFFIATAHPAALDAESAAYGVDVSHRGGRPGFIRIEDDGTLIVPDYSGNGFFNTLGNLQLNPRAGLLFVDFFNGHMLHLAVEAEIVWEGSEVDAVQGAERLLRLHPRQASFRKHALPLRWGAATLSPHLPNPAYWTATKA
jgi:predicted pyridoxine 5'-phosphate oxidase superfamily flavin-nucleotide-binding protein